MQKIFLFVVFALIAFTGLVRAQDQTLSFSADLTYNQSVSFQLPEKFIPPRPTGLFNITVTSRYTVLVCLQAGFQNLGDLASCDPNGLFNFTRTNESSQAPQNFLVSFDQTLFDSNEFYSGFLGDAPATTSTQSTTVRANVSYFLSFGFDDSSLPDTNATYPITVSISLNTAGCPVNTVGLPNGNCAATLAPQNLNQTQTVAPAAALYYNFPVPTGITGQLLVTLKLGPQQGFGATSATNLTLSIRRNAAPSNGVNDGSVSFTNGSQAQLSLPTPAAGDYYFQVVNNEKAPVSVVLSAWTQTCSGKSVGPNCSSTVQDLTDTILVLSQTGSGGYDYYTVSNDSLVLGVGTKKLKNAAPPLLVGLDNFPSNTSTMTQSIGNPVNFVHNNASTGDAPTTWYISVWANDGEQYYIWANYYCPNNCEGSGKGVNATSNSTVHGFCNQNTGTCDCDKGYSGLFCDRSRLATGWIVLLVIAPAIILAIAIGVPVACFLRNRRRAQYERV